MAGGEDLDHAAIVPEHPQLTLEDVKGCLVFAQARIEEYDQKPHKRPFNREEYDKALREAQEVWADVDIDERLARRAKDREEITRFLENRDTQFS